MTFRWPTAALAMVAGAGVAHAAASSADAAFRAELSASLPGTRAFVFDVGANDGRWSHSWSADVRKAHESGRALEVHLFEPQRLFRDKLSMLADRHNFTFVDAAVARQDGEALLSSRPGASQSATVIPAGNSTHSYSVRTIDLGGYLRKVLPSKRVLAYMKIDVEGMEYTILPFLLTSGALCQFSHLRIEWHLAAQTVPERLESLAMRHSLGRTLRLGCAVAPRLLEHEEFPPNNFAFPVPGIQELAALHTRWANRAAGGVHTSSWTSGKLARDTAELKRDHGADEERCAASPPLTLETGGFDHGLDRLRCNWNATGAAYGRAMQAALSPASAAARGVDPPWARVMPVLEPHKAAVLRNQSR